MIGSRRTMVKAHANWVDHLSHWHLNLDTDHFSMEGSNALSFHHSHCDNFSKMRQLQEDGPSSGRLGDAAQGCALSASALKSQPRILPAHNEGFSTSPSP